MFFNCKISWTLHIFWNLWEQIERILIKYGFSCVIYYWPAKFWMGKLNALHSAFNNCSRSGSVQSKQQTPLFAQQWIRSTVWMEWIPTRVLIKNWCFLCNRNVNILPFAFKTWLHVCATRSICAVFWTQSKSSQRERQWDTLIDSSAQCMQCQIHIHNSVIPESHYKSCLI